MAFGYPCSRYCYIIRIITTNEIVCDDCRTDFASGVQHFIFLTITDFSTVCVQNMHLLRFTSKQGWKVSITLVLLKVLHSYQCILSPETPSYYLLNKPKTTLVFGLNAWPALCAGQSRTVHRQTVRS